MSSLIMSQTWILRSNISYLTYCIDEQISKYLFYVLYNNDTPSKATHRNQRGKYLLGTWTLPGENVFWTRMIPFWSLLHCTNCYLWPANCAPDTCSPVPPPPVHETLHRMPHILCQRRRRRRGGGYQISMIKYVPSPDWYFSNRPARWLWQLHTAHTTVSTRYWVWNQCLERPFMEPAPRAAGWGGTLVGRGRQGEKTECQTNGIDFSILISINHSYLSPLHA